MSTGNPTPTPPKPAPAPKPSPPVLPNGKAGKGAAQVPASPVDQPATGLGGFAVLGLVVLGGAVGVGLIYGTLQLAPVRNFLGLPPKQKAVPVTKFAKP